MNEAENKKEQKAPPTEDPIFKEDTVDALLRDKLVDLKTRLRILQANS